MPLSIQSIIAVDSLCSAGTSHFGINLESVDILRISLLDLNHCILMLIMTVKSFYVDFLLIINIGYVISQISKSIKKLFYPFFL